MAEASLRPLPPIKGFLDRLGEAMVPKEGSDADTALFGDTFAGEWFEVCQVDAPSKVTL